MPDVETPEADIEEADISENSEVELEDSVEELSIEQLAEQLQSSDQKQENFAGQVTELKRSLGRVQSILTQQDKTDNTAKYQQEADERFNALTAAVAELVQGMDDESIPAGTRQKVLDIHDALRQRDARKQLVEELKEELKPAQSAPVQNAVIQTPAQTLETQVVDEIQSYGLDPDDGDLFDWKHAQSLLSAQGEGAVKQYFRKQIKANLTQEAIDERRQLRKESGEKKPKSTGPAANSPEDILHNSNDLAERLKAAKSMGLKGLPSA